jgi:ABC-2 type transport system ATP-binding protein
VSGEATAHRAAIDVRGLGIRYNLNLTKRTTLKGSLGTFLRRKHDAPTHFWALHDVSFRVEQGESLGVIGPNGAGKSTLLLALAGILEPSEGRVQVGGRISTLLTLGAGFEPELTGRENIDLVGAFLGVGRKDMEELAPAIIEFAELGAFIDAPVKTYSLGMKSRLGFSIATAVQPDILLLDEVLGTGDQVFRVRSQQRIRELMKSARAIVLVTHDLTYIAEFCNRAILLEQGKIVFEGGPEETVAVYQERVLHQKLLAASDAQRFGGEALKR